MNATAPLMRAGTSTLTGRPQRREALRALLEGVPLFAVLDAKSLLRLAKAATEIELPPASVIFRPGDPAAGMHIVITGRAKLGLPRNGDIEKVVALVGPGDTLGETAMFLSEPHMVSAETVMASRLIYLPKAPVVHCVRGNTAFALQMVASLSRRLRELMREIGNATTHSATQRVVDFLLAELPDTAVNGPATVVLPAKKRIIASRLNVTHEHFSRILHELAASGVIAIAGREIRLNDIAKLRALARS